MNMVSMKEIHKSKGVKIVIAVLIALALALVIFKLGMEVGERSARFRDHFGENYDRNFVGNHRSDNFGGFNFDRRLPPGGHGAVGRIVSIDQPSIVVDGPDNLEKTVIIKADTVVRQYREELTTNSLKIGDYVVVLGSPNDQGQIEAKLIRIVPPPPTQVNSNQLVQPTATTTK